MSAEEEFRQLQRHQIRMKLEGAARARRLAMAITSDTDRRNVITFAEELEAQAEELERALALPPPQTVQSQVQVQQGPPAEDEDEGKT